ncbi:hypothetical protein DPMN_172979 [Dreissena polymorpha]|uniref:Uncharacterized protein n=1 Tax=Dreissena polymorpha TaxID=45954 RepID=A0A9D4E202_DREPO|nr:hypothetical protein DPMN_172979 [Dreissena polymorpha]
MNSTELNITCNSRNPTPPSAACIGTVVPNLHSTGPFECVTILYMVGKAIGAIKTTHVKLIAVHIFLRRCRII